MPRTIKTTLELGGESAYKKGLQSVDRALKAMSKELSEATSKFAENSASLKNVSSVSNAYKNSVEQQKVKVESLKGAVETCNKKYEEAVKKYNVGDKINVYVVDVNPDKQKVAFSVKEFKKKQQRDEISQYMSSANDDNEGAFTLGDFLKNKNN